MQSTPEDKNLLQVIEVFGFETPSVEIIPISNGLINSTYKVSNNKSSILLQKLNHKVFAAPREIVQNYNKIYSFLKKENNYFLPEPVKTVDRNLCFSDADGNCWRAFVFINDTHTPETPQHTEDAYDASFCFGNFTRHLAGFDSADLKIIIPQFHDLAFRYQQFTEAVTNDRVGRRERIKNEIDVLIKKNKLVDFYRHIITGPGFKLRVMHHDAKISNILFDNKTNKVVCPVDLDTTQAGYYFSDLGDMIRSMACSHPENSIEFSQLSIRADFYTSIIDAYLSALQDELTTEEIKNIHYTGLLMIYMQTLRFMTDYLNGDIYYRIDYPEQNFDRARNQLILLQSLEEFLVTNYNFKA